MRMILLPSVAIAAVALTGAAAAPAAAPNAQWRPDVRTARTWAQPREGEVSFAVRNAHGSWGHRRGRPVRSASTVKTMLALAYLRRANTRHRELTDGERGLLASMIRRSSNTAATRVRNVVGNPALVRVAKRAGMRDFVVNASWGHCTTSARDQAELFWRVRRLAPARHRAYLMRLLATIVDSQRWGVGRIQPEGWDLYFKGGWGDGSGAVTHQGALYVNGRRRIALAVTTTDNPGHRHGARTIAGVVRRLLRGI
jgi:hypothetical protein